MSSIFLDSSYAIALSAPNDQYHSRALTLSEKILAENIKMFTTQAVLLEIGNALAKKRYRQAAIRLLKALGSDPDIDIVSLSPKLYKESFDYYQRRPDKEWGLTGCISFVVMNHYGLQDALTADHHFTQAGFRALLLES